MAHAFSSLDYAIVAAYLVASVVIGLWFARRQKTLEDYFVARRAAPWWAVGISVIATNLSAISYMGVPAYVLKNDLQLDIMMVLFPVVMLIVVTLFVPFLAALKLYTIYEYLERRFGVGVRTLASALFLMLRGGWLATAIYTQSLLLTEFTSIPLWECVLIVGGVTALYSVLGGMEAVLWTDVMQFFVLAGGILAMIIVVMVSFHGDAGQVWQAASVGGHTRMVNFDFSFTEITFWGAILMLFVINLSSYGSDQLIVQRYLTTSSKKSMVKAIMFCGWLTVAIMLLLGCVGVCLTGYYQRHPALLNTLENADRVVPHFVGNVLPTGLAGLVIAGVFAATMSSVSAGFNSLSTATMIDFIRRFGKARPEEDHNGVRTARLCTFGWAAVSTTLAMFVGKLGTIAVIMNKINGFFSGPLLGIFLLGLLTKRANGFGVLTGALVGTATTWQVATRTGVSFLWYGPVGLLTTVAVGYTLSCIAGGKPPADTVTLLEVRAKVAQE